MSNDTATTERWVPVPGYEGLYEISDLGRVRSLDRYVMRQGGLASGRLMRVRGRIIRPGKGSDMDRLKVSLHRDGDGRTIGVHVIVMLAFCGPRPAGMDICHNDGDATNNRLSNLRYDTRAANMEDMKRHGRSPQLNRTQCPRGHALAAPNLRLGQLERGARQCLACHRASAAGQKARRKGADFDMQAVSDARYAEIVAA